MKNVSINSGNFENVNNKAQNPQAPWPYDNAGFSHTVYSKPNTFNLINKCGNVRTAPNIEKSARNKFQPAKKY
eukprot:Pgem_evm1s4784